MHVDNEEILRADERAERRALLCLSLPAVLLVGFIVIVPVGWLFWLSLFDSSGWTLRNYARLYENPAYLRVFENTFGLSAAVMLATVLLGYPVAYVIVQLRRKAATFVLALVLLPFWTSLLVRTYAWLILLQRHGAINAVLQESRLIRAPLSLLYNYSGTFIGMTHVMLPFLILPLYASMRSIDPMLGEAGMSLGSGPLLTFLKVFLPLSLPGLLAGALLVFVYSLGFYIVPQLLGGGRVNMVAMKVAENASEFGDWGAASALGVVLLVVTFALLRGALQLSRVRL